MDRYRGQKQRQIPVVNRESVRSRLKSQSNAIAVFIAILTIVQVISIIVIGESSSDFAIAADNGLIAFSTDRKQSDDQRRNLEQRQTVVSLNSTHPIDNYYHRKHINVQKNGKRPILIIGGSDGSGTRAFVDMLGRLGVPMLVDDKETFDIHGKALFNGEGWPTLVKMVLDETHSANYTLKDLPDHVSQRVLLELEKLRDELESRATMLRAAATNRGRQVSENIEYGFKAPVTMLLLPILKEVFGPIKFLHILRDGRDVALSINTSPVDKFFDSYYSNAAARRKENFSKDRITGKEVLAMQLWNDWNIEVNDWSVLNNDGESFDYLLARSEDFLHHERRFEIIYQLSHFVHTKRPMSDLCCLSRREVSDLGRSSAMQDRYFGRNETLEDSFMLTLRQQFKKIVHRNNQTNLVDTDGLLRTKERADFFKKIQEDRTNQQQSLIKHRETMLRKRRFDTNERGVSLTNPGDKVAESKRRLSEEAHSWSKTPQDDLLLEDQKLFSYEDIAAIVNKDELGGLAARFLQKPHSIANKIPDGNGRRADVNVHERYGKWISLLADRPDLSTLVHRYGMEGLLRFGYQPPMRFMDLLPERYLCSASVVCPSYERI